MRVVEPLRFTTVAEREKALEEAHFNLYSLRAEDVLIDLLTDSGTCAISREQMAAMMRGDESYAGSASFYRMESAVRDLFGFEHVIPVHQGRAAERLLFQVMTTPGQLLPSNTLFDTTRANALDYGVEAADLPVPEFLDFSSLDRFKGNIDCEALEALLRGPEAKRIPFVLVNITNNICADQPVSLENLRETSRIAHQYGRPLYLDACRFAQNAWLIQQYEAAEAGRSVRSIVKEIFDLADGCYISAKKDAMGQIGGFLAVREASVAQKLKERMLLAEGFVTYGGMTGRDMEAVAVGLYEGIGEEHLRCRVERTAYLHEQLRLAGVPVISPPGGHAVYLPAAKILPHLAANENPGHALAVELYREGGVRGTKIALTLANGEHVEMLRLAIPGRVYSTSHLDYAADCMRGVMLRAEQIQGFATVCAPPLLGGFMAQYRQLQEAACTV